MGLASTSGLDLPGWVGPDRFTAMASDDRMQQRDAAPIAEGSPRWQLILLGCLAILGGVGSLVSGRAYHGAGPAQVEIDGLSAKMFGATSVGFGVWSLILGLRKKKQVSPTISKRDV